MGIDDDHVPSPRLDAAPGQIPEALTAYLIDVAGRLVRPGEAVEPLAQTFLDQIVADPAAARLVIGAHFSDGALPAEAAHACDSVIAAWIVLHLPIVEVIRTLTLRSKDRGSQSGVIVRFIGRLREALLEQYEPGVREAFEDGVVDPPNPNHLGSQSALRNKARASRSELWKDVPTSERDGFWREFRTWLPLWPGWPRNIEEPLKKIEQSAPDENARREQVGELIAQDIYLHAVEEFLAPRDTRRERNTDLREDIDNLGPSHLGDRLSVPFSPDEILSSKEELAKLHRAMAQCARDLPSKQRLAWSLILYPEIRHIEALKELFDESCRAIASNERTAGMIRAALDEASLSDSKVLWQIHGTELKRLYADFIHYLIGGTVGIDGINTNFSRAYSKVWACVRDRLRDKRDLP